MRIEDLVPPMKLCKQIPKGKFADSALVWCECGIFNNAWDVFPRECGFCEKYTNKGFGIPAPTLAEIMDALMEFKPNAWRNKKLDPEVPAWGFSLNEENYTRFYEFTQKNPATAALKIWLKLERGGE